MTRANYWTFWSLFIYITRLQCFAVACFDYIAVNEDELALRQNDNVLVLSKDEHDTGDIGWWLGRIESGGKQLQHYFQPISRGFLALCHRSRAVWACMRHLVLMLWMVIDACDPMLCPIHVFQASSAVGCSLRTMWSRSQPRGHYAVSRTSPSGERHRNGSRSASGCLGLSLVFHRAPCAQCGSFCRARISPAA